jgi:cyclopropane fatty-acyl-phospholipid synthase-like methyltransferase
MTNDRYERLKEMYAAGPVPWDHADPPPEVLDLIPTLPPGRALDLGCGLGRASIFMARHGWQVDGIDFVAQAIAEARERVQQAGVTGISFHVGSVTDLDFLDGPYDFALDVGCAHNFTIDELRTYHQHLKRLLKAGAIYLFFAHIDPENEGEPETPLRQAFDHGMSESTLRQLFSDGFVCDWVEHGQTTVGDDTWASAWFRFTRSDS